MNDARYANSFDFIRLVGSLLVLHSHSFAVAGLPEPVIGGFCSFGSLGVLLFFSISGYLVTASWCADPNPLRFGIRRSLRIFPGLAVAIVLSTFLLGPIVTALPVTQYLTHPVTYRYLENILLYINYALPGCFDHLPLANVVNGSLWSLSPEFLMYVLLGALGAASLVRRRAAAVIFTAGVWVLALYMLQSTPVVVPFVRIHVPPHSAPVLFGGMELHQVMIVAPYFWAGCLFWLFREHVEFRLTLAVSAFMVMSFVPSGDVRWLCSWIAIPYLVLAFGTQHDSLFKLPAWLGDLSYGIYIYAFPIQQFVYQFGHTKLSIIEMEIMGAIATCACAFLSWHVVENPALGLKPKRAKSLSAADLLAKDAGA